MFNILTFNKISQKGLNRFSHDYKYSENIDNPDAIMLRSFSLHEMNFPESLLAIGRCGAGVNNIPVEKCSENGIVVFNTPGANAGAVKELVLAGLLLSSRKISDGIEWVKNLDKNENLAKTVEKGKSKFAGPEINGKNLGVIGLGAIGIEVANMAVKLGMNVYGFDPYISVDSAWDLSSNVKHTKNIDELFSKCDYITIHVPLNDNTKNMIDKSCIEKMKDSVRILNFSRAQIVNTNDIGEKVKEGKIACYVTDFPTEELLDIDNVILIPHLGASTPEAEDNCAVMAANELIDFLENGNITNSVNFPNISMPKSNNTIRLCVLHKNIPNMIGAISTSLSKEDINIENVQSKSKGSYAYAIFDLNSKPSKQLLETIENQDGILRIRIII